MTAEEVTRALGGRWHGTYGTARCPCHDDHNDSLSITDGESTTLYKCFVGCSSADIAKNVAQKLNGHAKPNGHGRELAHPEFGKPTYRHDYLDAHGTLKFVVCRWEWPDRPKEIRPAIPTGDGWKWTLPKGPRPPYRLQQAIEETACGILIVEGEKKADIAANLFFGWVVVGWSGGAAAWSKTDWSLLPPGRKVCIWPDNDPPGIKAAQGIAANLAGHLGDSPAIVDVAALGLPAKFDLGDPIPDTLDPEAIADAAAPIESPPEPAPNIPENIPDAPPWDPPGEVSPLGNLKPSRARFWPSLKTDPRPEYLVKGVLDKGSLAEIYGPTGVGKSFLATDQGLHLAAGLERWLGCRVRQCGVLYVCAEGSIAHRMDAWSRHRDIQLDDIPFAAVTEPVNLLDYDGAEQIIVDAGAVPDLGVIYIDTAARATPGSDEGPEAMSILVAACDRIRAATHAAVCLVHHTGKDVGRGSRGSTVLPFATDWLLEVAANGAIRTATVAKARDGETGKEFPFRLLPIDLYTDEDGDPITSCVIDPVSGDIAPTVRGRKLKGNQATALAILADAMPDGLLVEEWNDRMREAGIGKIRSATLVEIRLSLKAKKVVHEYNGRWYTTKG